MVKPNNNILHIIVAAGSGSRFGSSLPKQFCELAGRPVLMTAISRFREYGRGNIVVVLSEQMVEFWEDLCRQHSFRSPKVVIGGVSRFDSVKNAIMACGGDADIITVHDGARPLVDTEVIDRVVTAVEAGAKGVVPAIAVTDSLRMLIGENGESESVVRSRFRAVQTPQGFDGDVLREAYSQPYRSEFTDDASVVESIGRKIVMVDGSPYNIKITNPADIKVAEAYLQWNV